MKKLCLIFIFLGGLMSAATLKTITISGVQVPVIYEKSSIIPTGSIQIIFSGAGSAYNGNHQGLAYLASLLLNEGTKEMGSTKFARMLEEKAIGLYVSSSQEFLQFDLSFLQEQEDSALNALALLLGSPNLTSDTLSKVKQKAIASLLAKESDFDYLASTGLMQMIFKNTPFQFPKQGNPPAIEKTNLAQIQNYLSQSMVLNRLTVVLGGDMNIDATLKKLTVMLSKLPAGSKASFKNYQANGNTQSKTQYKATEQAYIYFGSPFYLKDYKEEAYKAKVMSFILGASGFGSRMMEEIRVKKGLAYSAYMKINLSKLSTYASGHLQTKIANQEQSIALVKEVLEKFVQEGATQEELDGAKKFLLGSEPLRSETLSQRLSTAFANYIWGLDLDNQKRELQKIADLTLEDLNAFIKAHREILKLSFSIVTK